MIDLLLTRIVRGDPADTDRILECAALDSHCVVCNYFDDHERASRISGGQTLFIFLFVVINCLLETNCFQTFPVDDYLLSKNKVMTKR